MEKVAEHRYPPRRDFNANYANDANYANKRFLKKEREFLFA